MLKINYSKFPTTDWGMLCYVLNANRPFQPIYTELALEVFNNFQFEADSVIRIKPFVEQNKCKTLCKKLYKDSESHSVVSDPFQPRGLYSPWNSPGQNTGVGSFSLLQGIFPTQGSNPGRPHCRQILYQLSYQGSFLIP